MQRTDLNPLEEATGYQALADEFSYTQDDIAKIVGKSRSHVANTLRLLKLPEPGQGLHQYRAALRRPCARADRPAPIRRRPRARSSSEGLNVRQVEALSQVHAPAIGPAKKRAPRARKDADTRALEKRLSDALGLTVQIDHRGQGGTMRIRYRTLDQLDEVIRRLERNC